MTTTIDYYDKNATEYSESTIGVDFSATQERFLRYIPSHAKILDFGCGSGRDAKYFLDKGYDVDAIDGSKEFCRLASVYTGITVKQMLFQELASVNEYDGIWACASILHLQKDDLILVLHKMATALKNTGVIYASFKYGTFFGERQGRYFTDFNEERLTEILALVPELQYREFWISSDVRPDRSDEKWLNVILSRKA
ncbi:MAG: class I SAM-dependent methyltransferase [Fibrobacter sp.]|nr:class I SAM-dependent methyltransferase [Fibrobacter sp.]MBR6123371.1 class I SAM-dependent methyltransferase [Candidatus Saccharibacteria bacterium]